MSTAAHYPIKLRTVKETAVICGLSTRSIYEITKAGRLRSVRPTPFSVRYTDADIAAFIESLRHPATVS
ncbi:MAG: helix-turn-helix domain-containing protein [Planctomycetia bacterium]|nr:helix-turn-helix domain-containing protein [Planctomycetia bacterium]